MKRYKEYKESGVEWIGRIPTEWSAVKLKYLAKIRNGKDQKEVVSDDGFFPVLGTGGEFGRATSYLYDKPSVLLGRKGTIDKPQFIEEPFWTVDTLFYTEIFDNTIPKYLYYLSTLIPYGKLQESSAIPSMTQDKLHNVFLCRPTIQEQTIILDYINHHTSLIDTLITKKEQLIDKLKEQRQAIINEAITKGSNPNVKMKDSGIEWLGDIPESWEICKLKHLVFLQSGNFIPATEIENQGSYPVYGGNGLRGFTEKFNLDGDYVLIGRQGALCGNVNYAFGKFWATEHAVIVYPIDKIDVFYFGELLRLMNLNQYSESAAQPGISVSKISNLKIPKINLEEQKKISVFITENSKLINTAIQKVIDQVQRLKLFRQSLISEVVTGKIDVRDWQAPTNN